MKNNFIKTVQKMVAVTAIGPSALRNQGKGILQKAQKYCSLIDLNIYSSFINEKDFISQLDKETQNMLKSFGLKKRPWGTARKALNLFLRDALYNKYLSQEYKLDNIIRFLEIPLDSVVTSALKKRSKRGELPQWPGLKSLNGNISEKYQQFALNEASKEELERIHLDMFLWLENRK